MKIKVKPPLPKPAPEAQYKLTLSEAEFQIFLAYLKGTAGEPEKEPRKTSDAMLAKLREAGLSQQTCKWRRLRPIELEENDGTWG